jgi:hypothetical protein
MDALLDVRAPSQAAMIDFISSNDKNIIGCAFHSEHPNAEQKVARFDHEVRSGA